MNFLEGQNVSSSTWQFGILLSLEETAILYALSKAEKYWEIKTNSRETAGSLITSPSISESESSLSPSKNPSRDTNARDCLGIDPPLNLNQSGLYKSTPGVMFGPFPIKPQSKRKSCFPETDGKTPSGQDVFLNKLQFIAKVQSHSVPEGL